MNEQPLQPFAPPTALFERFNFSGAPSSGAMVEWVLYIVFAFWALYSLIALYHWLKYSHASWVALPAIALHLFVSVALMSYALSGYAFSLTPYLP